MKVRLTPSVLAWLRCFEATARHRSFTRAASELFVTQGAVSQQVKQLEQWLGRPLLLRTARALVPTPEGQQLCAVLGESLLAIEQALAQLMRTPGDRPVTLSCAPSFAMAWLTPRLGDFYRAHPGIGLRVIGEFHALDRERFMRDDIMAAVRFDLGAYADLQVTEFLDEWLLPVASPAWLAAHPGLRTPGDLQPAMLLHDSSPWAGAGACEEWADWLLAAGIEPDVKKMEAGRQFNLSQLAIGAAMAGQGIAMGRMALVLDDLVAGRLVAPFAQAVCSRASYRFLCPADPPPQTLAVRAWLVAQAEQFRAQRESFMEPLLRVARSARR